MDYRRYLMQMVQQGKAIKIGWKLQIINTQPYYKKSFSGSTGVYSGSGSIKKLIIDRFENDIDPLTTSISTLTIGKKHRKKASKKASKKTSKRKASKGGSIKRKSSTKRSL